MATLTKINDFLAGSIAVADDVDAEFQQIIDEFNGSIDPENLANNAVESLKIKDGAVISDKVAANTIKETHVKYDFTDGPKILKFGPNYPAAGAEFRIVPVTYSVTSSSGAGTGTPVTITFASSSLTYGTFTAFAETPHVIGEPTCIDGAITSIDVPTGFWISAISTTGATLEHAWHEAATAQSINMEIVFWGLVA